MKEDVGQRESLSSRPSPTMRLRNFALLGMLGEHPQRAQNQALVPAPSLAHPVALRKALDSSPLKIEGTPYLHLQRRI